MRVRCNTGMNRALGIVVLLVALGAGAFFVRQNVDQTGVPAPTGSPVNNPAQGNQGQNNQSQTDQNQANQTQPNQTPANPPLATQNQAAPPQANQTQGATAQQPLKPLNEANAKLTYEENTIDIVKRYEPGLAYIETEVAAQATPFDPFTGGGGGQGVQQGIGSGFFVNDAGDILTNYHVVRGANKIQVGLMNGDKTYPASVIGTAPAYDLALIRPRGVPKSAIKPIPLGNSDALEVGQKAVAMGAPFGLGFSVTQGIVSATNRLIPVGFGTQDQEQQGIAQRTVQTDAAINPGNSGGPLLDSTGRVIGINTQILSPAGQGSDTGQSAGVGFAIPINTARGLLPRLQAAKGGKVAPPLIGITSAAAGLSEFPVQLRQQYNLPESGVLIQQVQPGSPAAKAGLRGAARQVQIGNAQLGLGGDIVTKVDGQSVDGIGDLQSNLITKKPGDSVKLTIRRGDQTLQKTLTLQGGQGN